MNSYRGGTLAQGQYQSHSRFVFARYAIRISAWLSAILIQFFGESLQFLTLGRYVLIIDNHILVPVDIT
jgi:hypothetical protein